VTSWCGTKGLSHQLVGVAAVVGTRRETTVSCAALGHLCGGIRQKMLSGQSIPFKIGALAGRQQTKVFRGRLILRLMPDICWLAGNSMRTAWRWVFILWFLQCSFFYLIGTDEIRGIAVKGAFIGLLALGVAFLIASTIKEDMAAREDP
jgi:hypothetical protein